MSHTTGKGWAHPPAAASFPPDSHEQEVVVGMGGKAFLKDPDDQRSELAG